MSLTGNSSPNVKDEVLSAINAPAINMKIIEKLIADYILPSDKKGNIYEISPAKNVAMNSFFQAAKYIKCLKDFNIIICSDDETNRCFRMLNR